MAEQGSPVKVCDPPARTLDWVRDALGAGRVVAVHPLAGGMSSAVHRIRLCSPAGAETDVVLKRFVDEDWLAAEPDLAAREVAALEAVESIGISAPRALACDARGEHCDAPAVLMTFVRGDPELPVRVDSNWVGKAAAPLPPLHAAGESAAVGLPAYRPYNSASELDPPSWSKDPRSWKRGYELLGREPSTQRSLIHRDYHPCNLLWSGGELAAVIDWTMACSGPIAIDTAHCRMNLVCLYGVDAADAFESAYRQRGGKRQDPFWDLRCVVDMLPLDAVYPGWVELGRSELRIAEVQARIDAWVSMLVAEMRGD